MDIDAKVVGGNALAMKRIDAAGLAEEMARRHRVETVLASGAYADDAGGGNIEAWLEVCEYGGVTP